MLKVESVNLHWSSNSKAHRTNKFEICSDCKDPTPVLRRGQPFKISVTFDRPFKEVTDVVRVYFKCVDVQENSPRNVASVSRSTVTRASQISRDKDVWSLALLSQESNSIHLKMKSPSKIPFATFKLIIDTRSKRKPGVLKYEHHKNVYFLFNPWEKGDYVYMPDTSLLDEYVLNDIGKIFVGSVKRPIGQPWVFGQFAESVLPALILCLANSDLDFTKRGNPVRLVRALYRLLCATSDDKGVLRGKWEGNYDHAECTEPVLWNSSATIFEEYLKSEGKPVKYGKCWVFSALTTAACRAIGIPCRSVTNFSSARDTNASMTVDNYIIPEDRETFQTNDDSIWDFHAWNDVWMARHDLPQGYGGWQAIDCTPQSTDYEGEYWCGPASLVAIRKGEINHLFNTDLMTAAVNADVVQWAFDDDYEAFKPVSIDFKMIGKVILTKLPFVYDPHGDADFEDITDQYKEKEGTKEERLAFFNALKECSDREAYEIASMSFVEFKLNEIDSIDIGEDIVVHLEIKNESMIDKTVVVNLNVATLYYNGNKGNLIKNFTETIKIESHMSNIVKMRIPAVEYASKLVELSFVKMHAIARVLEENFIWAEEDHFVINMPEIVISTKNELRKKREGKLLFTIRNPLKRKLTDCKIVFEAPGIGRNVPVPIRDILAEEEVTVEHTVVPDLSGEFYINALFDSKQLKSLMGCASLIVA